MLVISDTEVIRHVLLGLDKKGYERHPRYVCYFGAGGSLEAGVPTADQICQEIRRELREAEGLPLHSDEKQYDEWDISELNWNKPSCYMTCMRKAFGNAAERVEYFRKMLIEKPPSFSHHALALLMKNRYMKSTCITTNFDKLIETSFMHQDFSESQPIRNEEEAKYWINAQDRYYVLKLHGDYDTDNILNTVSETVKISATMLKCVQNLLDYSGLVAIGTAGNEKSVHTMFDTLAQEELMNRVLRFGLYWSVYVGSSRPADITQADIESLVIQNIKKGYVGEDIYRMIEYANRMGRPFYFFPIWGAGNFFFDLVKATNDPALISVATQSLDHKMRLRHVFSSVGLSDQVIDEHINYLENRQRILKTSEAYRPEPEEVFTAENQKSGFKVSIIYGDITSRALLSSDSMDNGRIAVVSPEDTCISAGGGVAYLLLIKAGKQFVLNELAKLAPITQSQVAVTSGGKLPVHYIFHTAAIKLTENNGKLAYVVSKESVQKSVLAVLDQASALEVNSLYVPLLGAGVAGLDSEQSLEGILEAIRDWEAVDTKAVDLRLIIYRDKDLERHLAGQCLERILSDQFIITKVE